MPQNRRPRQCFQFFSSPRLSGVKYEAEEVQEDLRGEDLGGAGWIVVGGDFHQVHANYTSRARTASRRISNTS